MIFKISNQEPFNQVDFMTKLNRENKELILYESAGICFDTFKIYNLTDGIYSLSKITRFERDDELGKCFRLTFHIVNTEEKLILKEEVTNK